MIEYLINGLAIATGLYMAWNIGANDVANSFGTAVGSGSLSFKRALILAAIFEFSGAFFCGSHVADTIRGGIVVPEFFIGSPLDFALGMLSALLGASIWLHIATCYGKPVSTTHAIIGAVVGFGVLTHGTNAIQWNKMTGIVLSWFISPVVGALLGYLTYSLIRRYVLRSHHPLRQARIVVPVGTGVVIAIIILSSCKDLLFRFMPVSVPLSVKWSLASIFAVVAGVLSGIVNRIILLKRQPMALPDDGAETDVAEQWFGWLLILTACYMSFAHGANDVANAIGPMVGVIQALSGSVIQAAPVPLWVLALGALGIVAGLAMYGHKVIEAVGRKITEITPTRGFAAQFGTATTVLVCSLMGLPISTTFVLVGAVLGVGLARGVAAIDLRVVRGIFMSWIITLPVSAIGSIVVYWLLKLILKLL
jgi:PiT family inorganic phosphate transporter